MLPVVREFADAGITLEGVRGRIEVETAVGIPGTVVGERGHVCIEEYILHTVVHPCVEHDGMA